MTYTEKGAIEPLKLGMTIEVRGIGNSMTPILQSGEIVTVVPIAPEDIRKGDIVIAKVKGRVYMHLVKAVAKDMVLIGNNHGHNNGWTAKTNVYGKVKL